MTRRDAAAVGIKDVAREAGVSVGTVSNVLNRPDTVSPDTRRRVLTTIEVLGYVRSETARQLRSGSSRMVAVLVLDLANPFFAGVAKGAERAASEVGLRTMVCSSAESAVEEADYLALFAEQRVRGVLVTPADSSGGNLERFRRHGIPYVYVDRELPPDQGCSVAVDDVTGGALAVRHLLAAGHRRVTWVSGPPHLPQCQDRRAGALAALTEAGLPASALTSLATERLDVASGADAGARLLGLPTLPSAVFCANDLLALGVLQTLVTAGVRVPDEVALVGYDDIEFAAAAAVPLTSVRQPAEELGRVAVRLLAEEAGAAEARPEDHHHRAVVLRPELVVRRSSRAPRPG
ncbi:LacI family DNA-binding transcriptional regulator [Streptomyces lonarensis]|uniref:LacI family transcriptional regulator n=1 Tax=Streptomyces lonarensis TaxID=700599 RepID=A0A7X6CZC6_9ACTN|nr:LacI family DNA-binding transcriptional regulator [Streptomyces lonarensis]NJQ05328.1 LacI family transcriptional regulator [Streptomyces lonarensis]